MEAYVAKGTKMRREEKHAKLDLQCTVYFSTLPSFLADSTRFQDLLTTADPTYKTPTRQKLDEELIPGEAEAVLERQLELLRKEHYLTVSFDGGTKKGESHYTVHVSTSDRRVYLMEARHATDESHTGEWTKNLAMTVLVALGQKFVWRGKCH
ncbi:hypothetical protein K435DRAFT_796113 [Dendrothele bispora CBS 962.96]|uniref:Uncharacterized protein n=1 Tax=Dendrothele bispora (strain CBS 962.96) TaxID=1314807 RepID=A0A4V4HG96_DENBC|nr:hypothetical protein K435DRAFT_796113 [Dendrothele bispora CBS 962.96]